MLSPKSIDFYKKHAALIRNRRDRREINKHLDKLDRAFEKITTENDFYAALNLMRWIAEKEDYEAMLLYFSGHPFIAGCPDIGGAENALWAASLPKISLSMLMVFAGAIFGREPSRDSVLSEIGVLK